MANKKMTKKDYFEQIMANYPLTDDEVAFVKHELELLSKKNASNGEKALSAKQKENLSFGETILSVMEHGRLYQVAEITKIADLRDENGDLLSTQRVSPIMNRLVADGKLTKTIDKRKTLFSLVD